MNIIKIVKNVAGLKARMPLIGSIFAVVIIAICLLGVAVPETTNADLPAGTAAFVAKESNAAKIIKAVKTVRDEIKVTITAYSSTPDQTDDTPFITASGKQVADGIAANNMLPMGTKITIPELYGDKVFVIEDRMNKRMGDYRLDIWMPTREEALHFGVKTAEVHILEN